MDDIIKYSSLDNLLGLAVAPTPSPQPTQEQEHILPLPGVGAPMEAMPQYEAFANAEPQSITPPMRPMPTSPKDLVGTLREALKEIESSGNYQAKNPTTSASGAYQYVKKTWGNFGGYPEARLAPKAVQDAKVNQDLAIALRKFNGDPFRVIANHMLPAQANKPWLWTQPSYYKTRKGVVEIPPVAAYVQKVIKGTPYENQFNNYMSAYVSKRQ